VTRIGGLVALTATPASISHLEPFLREVSDHGEDAGLPRFVERECREFLTCGLLAHGFTPLRCADCTFERLVLFSCKARGFCPSCARRRRAERAESGTAVFLRDRDTEQPEPGSLAKDRVRNGVIPLNRVLDRDDRLVDELPHRPPKLLDLVR